MGRIKKEDRAEAVKELGEELRRRGAVAWRSGVVGEDRHEYFRGKDFARHLREHPDKMAGIVDSGRPLESQIEEVCDLLISLKQIVACERTFKKSHPGRKRLVKFPRKLTLLPSSQQKFKEGNFYAWLEERPTPLWQNILSIIMAGAVVAVCLFPLAPYWLRISVVYFFLGLLVLIFSIILIRFIIFATVFVVTGYELWVFPNLVSDQVDFMGAFTPLLTFGLPEDNQSHILSRVASLLGGAILIYVLYMYSPDEKGLKDGVESAHDSILDMLNMNPHKPSITASSGPGSQYTGPPKFDNQINPEKAAKQLFEWRKAQKAAKAEAAAKASLEMDDDSAAEAAAQAGEDSPENSDDAGSRDDDGSDASASTVEHEADEM